MSVKLRHRPAKGWYVLIDWRNQRKAKFFGKDKASAKQFRDKLDARLKWAEVSGEPIALARPDQQMPSVKTYLTSWLESYASVHLKPSTAEGYRQVCEGHLYSAIGDKLLHALTRADVKRLIGQLLAKGLKKRTIHNILTPLKEAFHHAIDEQLIASNPVAKLGRYVTAKEGASAHINPLTAVEVRRVLEQAKTRFPEFYPLLLCALRTGMRRGELLGLQWGDIDFAGHFIEVRRAVVRRQVTSTKTHRIRRVDMSAQLSGALKELKETRSLEASLKGTAMPEWVFLTPHGHRMTTEVLQKAFCACLDGAEIRRVRFHDCRHTYASLLIQQGANVKYIQQSLVMVVSVSRSISIRISSKETIGTRSSGLMTHKKT